MRQEGTAGRRPTSPADPDRVRPTHQAALTAPRGASSAPGLGTESLLADVPALSPRGGASRLRAGEPSGASRQLRALNTKQDETAFRQALRSLLSLTHIPDTINSIIVPCPMYGAMHFIVTSRCSEACMCRGGSF